MAKRRRTIGLALGSGGARGWAHIGALKALFELGFRPDVIVGTSIGALVGAMVAAGVFERFVQKVERLDWFQLARFFTEFRLPRHGLLSGRPVVQWLNSADLLGGRTFESLEVPFAAVATDLYREEAVVLREGSVVEAVRASLSIPGIFVPVVREGRVLVDGGIVDPVPVRVARAMGADVVIAIDINLQTPEAQQPPASITRPPTFFQLLLRTMRVVENHLSRQGLRQSPADLLLCPAIGHIQTLDFSGGRAAIQSGEEAVLAQKAALLRLLAQGDLR